MKTLDEVINIMEGVGLIDWGADALVYLKEYAEMIDNVEPNEPLDWDEFKQMVGKPVWVEYNFQISNKEFRDKSKRWCIVREIELWDDTEIVITENGFILSKREQVKDWQAYRKERG